MANVNLFSNIMGCSEHSLESLMNTESLYLNKTKQKFHFFTNKIAHTIFFSGETVTKREAFFGDGFCRI